MDVGGQTVCASHSTAREKALIFIEVEVGWVLELVCMLLRRDSSIAHATF